MSSPNNTIVASRRPLPTDFKPMNELTVGEMLEDPRVKKAMQEAAPKHMSPDRLVRVMAQAFRKTPKLAQCHPLSLMGAMIQCATLGLEPNTPLGHAYLIPFEKRVKRGTEWVTESVEVNLILGYQGLIDLCRRSGNLVALHADVVYDGDDFSFEYGSNMHLRHVPQGARENRRPIYAYAHSKLTDGEAFEVLPYAEVLKIRDGSQSYKQAIASKGTAYGKNWASTPWVAYEHEMVCKTMVRRLAKWLPKSIELATAIQTDSLAERGMIDFAAIAHHPELAGDPDGASREEEPEAGAEVVNIKQTPPPKPPAPAKAAAPAPAPTLTEEDEREADRLTRAAQGEDLGGESSEEGDGWGDYVEKMLGEFNVPKIGTKAQTGVSAAFRDAVLGALGRKEITDDRANELLAEWKTKTTPTPGPVR